MKENENDQQKNQNYRPPDLKEKGYTNKTCFRCQETGFPVLQAGEKTAIIHLCPNCDHMWIINHQEQKIEEIPKELPHYQEIAKKLRQQYKEIL
ncbi:hypothetical protein [Methanonatronarchaeum sp. AMET-Sl]|uniref:hypothetical protein n=1 Tax=Methanonatronarchaeum sp. AMET-Sl TaxID=3037654 RepID=UPI00244DD895|nr:hypothetical protein [Methanonatronarchaeum sp. AMET-Sl]WGI18002.1 hypothetical protein QEN48_03075 [Methanonatronarchaeum sp. AMET-Sl]